MSKRTTAGETAKNPKPNNPSPAKRKRTKGEKAELEAQLTQTPKERANIPEERDPFVDRFINRWLEETGRTLVGRTPKRIVLQGYIWQASYTVDIEPHPTPTRPDYAHIAIIPDQIRLKTSRSKYGPWQPAPCDVGTDDDGRY
jgi:hypothetical protein